MNLRSLREVASNKNCKHNIFFMDSLNRFQQMFLLQGAFMHHNFKTQSFLKRLVFPSKRNLTKGETRYTSLLTLKILIHINGAFINQQVTHIVCSNRSPCWPFSVLPHTTHLSWNSRAHHFQNQSHWFSTDEDFC